MATRIDQDDFYARYPRFRSFIAGDASRALEPAFLAAFVGTKGPFAVYATRIDRTDPVPGVVFVCTLDTSVVLVELEDGGPWYEESAIAVADALADGAIAGSRKEDVLRIGAHEENAAFELARRNKPAAKIATNVIIISGPFEGFPARLVEEGERAVVVEVVLFGKATRVRLSADEVRRTAIS